MGNTINYTDASAKVERSLDNATVISDFLPSPAELNGVLDAYAEKFLGKK